jgi:phosphoglycerate kinase
MIKIIEPNLVAGKKILLRLDLNVPIKDGIVTDNSRITRSLPTLKMLLENNAKQIIIISHFGRPKGKIIPEMSLKPIAKSLADELGMAVDFNSDYQNITAKITLLENIRFHEGEEKNDEQLAQKLANLGDIYINDAFSCSHRAHASIVAITKFLPSYAGLLVAEEVKTLTNIMSNAQRPKMAIIGGAKVSTKIELLKSLVKIMDVIVVAGGMANTFLKSLEINIGKSLVEDEFLHTAKEVLLMAKEHGCTILLPTDVVVAKEFKENTQCFNRDLDQIENDDIILDIGEQTIYNIGFMLENIKTLVWNGPMGAFEIKPFDKATITIAKVVAALTRSGQLQSIAGGGDVVAALNIANVANDFSYISTAGGAFLEWLEGKELVGISALK